MRQDGSVGKQVDGGIAAEHAENHQERQQAADSRDDLFFQVVDPDRPQPKQESQGEEERRAGGNQESGAWPLDLLTLPKGSESSAKVNPAPPPARSSHRTLMEFTKLS